MMYGLGSSVIGQVSALNTLAGDDEYTILRGMVEQTNIGSASDLNYTYRLHGHEKSYIQYFIGPQSFLTKGDLDIYNHVIHTDFDNLGLIQPYQIERGRIDSLYLLTHPKSPPIAKYIYDSNNDQFGKIIHQGRYDIVDGLQFEIQKGGFNPVVDSEPRPSKLVIKKSVHLIDSGFWYRIPKSKKELTEFIKLHFKKKIDKARMKGKKSLDVIIELNENGY